MSTKYNCPACNAPNYLCKCGYINHNELRQEIDRMEKEVNNLSPEQIQTLTRKARDKFNKTSEIKTNLVAKMILGGLINTNDLCKVESNDLY